MIDKLRKKIIAINVVSVCIVFFVAVVLLFVTGFTRLEQERNNRILNAFDFDYETEDFAENKIFNDIALVIYDTDTLERNCFIGENAELDEQELTDSIKEIAESSRDNGWVSLSVRYAKRVDGNLVKIVFSNRYSRHGNISQYLILAVGTLLIGVGCYLAISMILAQIALKPVEESWSKQKQFVADASHELKTPLSVIMANTDIIASHQDETVASQMKWIENTRQEADRMAVLVADLLFLAKNDDGLKVQLEKVNMSDGLETTVLSYDAVFYENGKHFCYEISPNVNVLGNVGQLKQLTTILLDNANKYSTGEGNIVLKLVQTGRRVVLTVSNDSDELTTEQLSHLFDRFYTVDKSRNTDKGGNGLGLSIAQMISHTHGGDIRVDYNNGRTTFTVDLPVYKERKEYPSKP